MSRILLRRTTPGQPDLDRREPERAADPHHDEIVVAAGEHALQFGAIDLDTGNLGPLETSSIEATMASISTAIRRSQARKANVRSKIPTENLYLRVVV